MNFGQVLFAVFASMAAAVPHIVYVQHTVTVTNPQPVIVTVMVPPQDAPQQLPYAASSDVPVINVKRFE
jgi:hypothetical protein